ncbi:hypothetical protein OOK39_02345 [Streptomyces sp. NBC_00264]|uniref:hypothetical protein n=1 Tax=unclassified Streptomyces TaxID=2593676 RepID=UPI0022534AE1|nr:MULTISPECIES: hypothetical protein [unclassified Streptomyces]MCX5158141.1 hypothetical protein [Streptomyces sp. NBC_00305]MCX5216664.1 hypothetical protein [Streptomyces sp. NBC_00264]
MTAPLSPQREAEIRAFEEDEHRNVLTMGRDLDDLLAELDRVRAELAALPAPVVETAFRDALGNLWPVGHFPAETEARVLETTPTIQRTVRISEWTEVTS